MEGEDGSATPHGLLMENLDVMPLRNAIDGLGNIAEEYCDTHVLDERFGLMIGITNTSEFMQIHVRSSKFMKTNTGHKRIYLWSLEDEPAIRAASVNSSILSQENVHYDSDSHRPDSGIFFGNVIPSLTPAWENVYADDGTVVSSSSGMLFNAAHVKYFDRISQADGDGTSIFAREGGALALRHEAGELVGDVLERYSGWKIIQDQFETTIGMGVDASGAHLWVYELPDNDEQEGVTLRLQWYKPGRYALAFVVHHDFLYASRAFNPEGFHVPGDVATTSSNYDSAYPAFYRLITGRTTMAFDVDGNVGAFATVAVQSDENSVVNEISRSVKHLGLRLFSGIEGNRVDDGAAEAGNEGGSDTGVIIINDVEEYDINGNLLPYFVDDNGLVSAVDYKISDRIDQGADSFVNNSVSEWWSTLQYKIASAGDGDAYFDDENLLSPSYEPSKEGLTLSERGKQPIAHYLSTQNTYGDLDSDHIFQINFRQSQRNSNKDSLSLSLNGVLVFSGLTPDIASLWEGSTVRLTFQCRSDDGTYVILPGLKVYSSDLSKFHGESVVQMRMCNPKTWSYEQNVVNSPVVTAESRKTFHTAFLLQPFDSPQNANTVETSGELVFRFDETESSIFDLQRISWEFDISTVTTQTQPGERGKRRDNFASSINHRTATSVLSRQGVSNVLIGLYRQKDDGTLVPTFATEENELESNVQSSIVNETHQYEINESSSISWVIFFIIILSISILLIKF